MVNPQPAGGGEPCKATPLLASLSKGAGASILKAYGYDLREPWACTKIDSPLVVGATVLRFRRITSETDDYTTFSVVKVASSEYVWIIPTTSGMLEVPHAESDPHNIAAFNALLRLHKAPLGASGLLEAGKFYMALLGHTAAIPLVPEVGVGDISSAENESSVSFSDRLPVPGEAFNKWTLTFETGAHDHSSILSSVARETVQPGK